MSVVSRTQQSFLSISSDEDMDSFTALPSAVTANAAEGLLEVTILSVYDLPTSDQPKAITLSCCGITVSTGPPVARHKDKNSFRFSRVPTSSPNSSSRVCKNDLKIAAPLQGLYNATMTIRLIYENKELNLLAEQDLNEFRIHQSSWLILNFKPESGTAPERSIVNDDFVQPTLRLKLQVNGPFRPEIAALVGLFKAWFALIDQIESNTKHVLGFAPKIPMPDSKYFLIPAVPIVTTIVVASPVVAAILMVGLPLFLPLILMLITAVIGLLMAVGVLYASCKHGREHIGGTMAPFGESLISTPSFQKLIYNTGPRPTPVTIARIVLPREMWGKLIVSLFIDMVGSSSYLLPVVGEGLDLAWAPMQTILVMAMYDATSPNLKYVSFMEEILPFTDIVPSATIGWGIEFVPKLLGNTLEGAPEVTSILARTSAAMAGNPK